MLSISTGRNQSMKVCGVYIFQQKEYNYKVITRCDIILQAYYITDRHKSIIYIYERYKKSSWAIRDIPWTHQEELDREELQLVSLLHKISSIIGRRVHFSPSFRSLDMQVLGSHKATQRVIKWDQVACIIKHMCIDKIDPEKHVLKNISWTHTWSWSEASSNVL